MTSAAAIDLGMNECKDGYDLMYNSTSKLLSDRQLNGYTGCSTWKLDGDIEFSKGDLNAIYLEKNPVKRAMEPVLAAREKGH